MSSPSRPLLPQNYWGNQTPSVQESRIDSWRGGALHYRKSYTYQQPFWIHFQNGTLICTVFLFLDWKRTTPLWNTKWVICLLSCVEWWTWTLRRAIRIMSWTSTCPVPTRKVSPPRWRTAAFVCSSPKWVRWFRWSRRTWFPLRAKNRPWSRCKERGQGDFLSRNLTIASMK